VGKHLKLTAGALGGAGVVLGAVRDLLGLEVLLYQHFWIIFVVSSLLILTAIWPEPEKTPVGFVREEAARDLRSRLGRYRWVFLAMAALSSLGIWWYWQPRIAEAPIEPIPPPEPIGRLDLQIDFIPFRLTRIWPIADAYASESPPLELLYFWLADNKTSYTEIGQTIQFGKPMKLYTLSEDAIAYLAEGKPTWEAMARAQLRTCQRLVRNSSISQTLREFTVGYRSSRKGTLLPALQGDLAGSIALTKPSRARLLVPTTTEWKELSKSGGTAYENMLTWAVQCRGYPFPALETGLRNRTDELILITDVDYEILEIKRIMAAGETPGPMTAAHSYSHRLDPQWSEGESGRRIGRQHEALKPPFKLPAGATAAFDLQLRLACDPKYSSSGETWWMRMTFVTTAGRLQVPDFALFLLPACG